MNIDETMDSRVSARLGMLCLGSLLVFLGGLGIGVSIPSSQKDLRKAFEQQANTRPETRPLLSRLLVEGRIGTLQKRYNELTGTTEYRVGPRDKYWEKTGIPSDATTATVPF